MPLSEKKRIFSGEEEALKIHPTLGRGGGPGGGGHVQAARRPRVPVGRLPRQPRPGQTLQGEARRPGQGHPARGARPRHDVQVQTSSKLSLTSIHQYASSVGLVPLAKGNTLVPPGSTSNGNH